MTIAHFQTAIQLRAAPIRPNWIVEGEPIARNAFISGSHDEHAYTLVWDCTAGKFHWFYDIDETVYILEGAVVVTGEDGLTTRLNAGDLAFFPCGSRAHWHVESYVRKVAFCRNPMPTPIALAHKVYRKLSSFTNQSQSA